MACLWWRGAGGFGCLRRDVSTTRSGGTAELLVAGRLGGKARREAAGKQGGKRARAGSDGWVVRRRVDLMPAPPRCLAALPRKVAPPLTVAT